MPHSPLITLTTDFGVNDHFVGTVKGVILDLVPDATIVDICHAVQPFDILDGALTVLQAYSYFPSGTVHMVIVDPGVGTARRPILATVGTITFVHSWNAYLLPLVMLNTDDLYPWPLGIMVYQGEYSSEWHLILAFITLTILPTIILFILAQRHIVAGLTAGAVKG